MRTANTIDSEHMLELQDEFLTIQYTRHETPATREEDSHVTYSVSKVWVFGVDLTAQFVEGSMEFDELEEYVTDVCKELMEGL